MRCMAPRSLSKQWRPSSRPQPNTDCWFKRQRPSFRPALMLTCAPLPLLHQNSSACCTTTHTHTHTHARTHTYKHTHAHSPSLARSCLVFLMVFVLFVCLFACLLACLLVCLFVCFGGGSRVAAKPGTIQRTTRLTVHIGARRCLTSFTMASWLCWYMHLGHNGSTRRNKCRAPSPVPRFRLLDHALCFQTTCVREE